MIDRLSAHGDARAVKFPAVQLKHPDRRTVGLAAGSAAQEPPAEDNSPRFDFSYSGIKTSVLRYVETHNMRESVEARRKALSSIAKPKLEDYLAHCDRDTLNLIASFQYALIEDLTNKTLAAAREYDAATVFVTGGVAANQELRQTFERKAAQQGLPVFFPSRPLSTDNAAMIAAAAYPKYLARDFASMEFSAEPGMVLR